MEDIKSIRRFLIRKFLLTLILVGIAQLILNMAMRTAIMPLFERIIGLGGFLSGRSLTEGISAFLSCLLTLFMRSVIGSGSVIDRIINSPWAAGTFGEAAIESARAFDANIGDTRLWLYAIKVVVLCSILVAIWVLPFVIGATIYSQRVQAKITELENRRIAREKEYEKRRNLLLSDITHDIKTPITTMAGFSKALADGTVPEEQKQEYLDAVYNKSMKVSELVTMLFDYIKMDSQGYVLNKTDLDFCEFIRECVAGTYAEFEDKKLEVELDIPETRIMVSADRMQLERAINNLLTNTVKHNEEGTKIDIRVKKELSEVVFQISDSGAKIDKEDAIHIFEPFVRGDKSRKSGSGNGLGLSIAKRIVEMHGGRILLIQYNNPDKYKYVKTFEIKLPLK